MDIVGLAAIAALWIVSAETWVWFYRLARPRKRV